MSQFIFIVITVSALAILKPAEGTFFTLYNRNYPKGYNLKGSPDDAEKFRKNESCKYVTHGFLFNAKSDSVQDLVKNYLLCRYVNVIAVDWSLVSKNILYPVTIYATQVISKILARKMMELEKAGACMYNETHCIGHSMGAHICGGAGKIIQKEESRNISRVTGLDPAGGGFQGNPVSPSNNMSSSEACFVDSIDTDDLLGHSVPQSSQKVEDPLAQALFVVNGGGATQPGCPPIPVISNICGHLKSYQIYANSICKPHEYPSTKCGSHKKYEDGDCKGNQMEYLGEDCSDKASGIYYVSTNKTTFQT